MKPTIKLLHRNQINDDKWNKTITNAVNSLPYAYTWYLDAICERWMALVLEDYDYVLPLPVHRKWGVVYVYQPLFCQQLGVFYKRKSPSLIEAMYAAAMKKFLFLNLNGNYDSLPATNSALKHKVKKNIILTNLSNTEKGYNENTLRNIKKAAKAGVQVKLAEPNDFEAFIDFYIPQTAQRDKNFKPRHDVAIRRLVQQFILHDCAKLFTAQDPDGNLCSGVMIVETPTRLIHLLPASNDYARLHGIMQFITDHILRHYQSSGKIYDFEGSSVPSIAKFYEGFGGVNQPFFELNKGLWGIKTK